MVQELRVQSSWDLKDFKDLKHFKDLKVKGEILPEPRPAYFEYCWASQFSPAVATA